jgi:hypothetical protein
MFGFCQILEEKMEYSVTVCQLFIDFERAFDSVGRKDYTTFSLTLVYQ